MISTSDLQKLIANIKEHQYKTPFMLTDLEVIRSKCLEFKSFLPTVQLYYAVKAYSDKEVINAIDDLVDGYDIASTNEIAKLIKIGVKPTRIAFSNPVKSEAALRQATKMGVNRFAYQSKNELFKIKQCNSSAQVYLRVKVSDQASSIGFSSKFGCEPGEAVGLLEAAKELGLNPIGLTFHVGSQANNTSVWSSALKTCKEIINQASNIGISVNTINLGGGFPVQYTKIDPTISDTASQIKQAINEHIPNYNQMNFIAEPGRFLVADSSVIVAEIIGVEERGNKTWLFLDVGSFQAFIEIFEFNSFPYPVYSLSHLLSQASTKKTKKYVLTGPSCDSYDTMAYDIELPTDLAKGNKLLISMTGAYTVVYGSNFNGFRVPPRKFID
jgi:ornithine decarboxylase